MTTKQKKYTEIEAVGVWLNGSEEEMKAFSYYCFENNISTGDLIEQGLDKLCRVRTYTFDLFNLQTKTNEMKLKFEAQVGTLMKINRHEEILKAAESYNQLAKAVSKLQKKLNGGF